MTARRRASGVSWAGSVPCGRSGPRDSAVIVNASDVSGEPRSRRWASRRRAKRARTLSARSAPTWTALPKWGRPDTDAVPCPVTRIAGSPSPLSTRRTASFATSEASASTWAVSVGPGAVTSSAENAMPRVCAGVAAGARGSVWAGAVGSVWAGCGAVATAPGRGARGRTRQSWRRRGEALGKPSRKNLRRPDEARGRPTRRNWLRQGGSWAERGGREGRRRVRGGADRGGRGSGVVRGSGRRRSVEAARRAERGGNGGAVQGACEGRSGGTARYAKGRGNEGT